MTAYRCIPTSARRFLSTSVLPKQKELLSTGFSCDLVAESQKHLRFLKGLHNECITLNLRSCSVRRYRDLWLPMVASVDTELIPPPDVAWLWHCHRLSPAAYAFYCSDRFQGKILEPLPPFVFQTEHVDSKVARGTREHWGHWCNEPFFLPAKNNNEDSSTTPQLGDGYDLLASAHRQANFLWQVSDDRFSDPDFLAEGVANYTKFLHLSSLPDRKLPVVPTYQVSASLLRNVNISNKV